MWEISCQFENAHLAWGLGFGFVYSKMNFWPRFWDSVVYSKMNPRLVGGDLISIQELTLSCNWGISCVFENEPLAYSWKFSCVFENVLLTCGWGFSCTFENECLA